MDKNNPEKPSKPAVSVHSEREARILAKWKSEKTFEKSLEKDSPKGQYTFYDGPPFANGPMHYGHILAGTIKDVLPRWKTMQGYHVKRRWGWDCHGLPVENMIEKELKLATKKDIVEYGIQKFNEAAEASVMRFANDWRELVPRLGRWVDMDHDYRTMDASYTETVWWIFKRLYDKGLIYEGFKSMNICPRCETTLSNFEVAQGYKDITDISVYVKFKLKDIGGKQVSEASEPVYFLAWTTTPWTLPGNVALAINTDIEYVKVRIVSNEQQKSGLFIIAKERLGVLKDLQYEILESMKGGDLVGKEYEPLFDYYSKNEKLGDRNNGWKVYGAEFVTTEDGTGIVHIAPAFGADDYELLKTHKLPFVQHVTTDGRFKDEVSDWKGMPVKPIDTEAEKNAHQKADIEIIKWLAHHGNLFDKEKLVHSYPHCWRCDTPLLNYAASSWFVKVTEFKDKAVKENEKVFWVPKEVGEARFGNWLKGARDWAISRSRFWGAPIPVWKHGKEAVVLGSISDIKKYSRAKNSYFAIRHGEAVNNAQNFLSGLADAPHGLTEKGKIQVADSATSLSEVKFDLMYVSPFVRTQETAKILKDRLGLSDSQIIIDDRIRELGMGTWNGKDVASFVDHFSKVDRFLVGPEGGENYSDVKKRMGEFIYDIEKKHEGKTILIVSHETPIFLLEAVAEGLTKNQIQARGHAFGKVDNAEVKKIDFAPLPHNKNYELDLHRPYIDDVELFSASGEKLVRVPDVFDCWFESGSMPYGESHYPFENRDEFDPEPGMLRTSRRFPADFIAEGLDQTRGWFYSMLMLGVALFGKSPYKKVIANGLILAENGQKMSKRLNNYPDPKYLIGSYGADAVRYYLLSSPAVRGQDLCFSEKGVDEVTKKVINRLLNVVSFFEMYRDEDYIEEMKQDAGNLSGLRKTSLNILDAWIVSRTNQTIEQATSALEAGELDRATRPFGDFVEDISTWYLRRSRDRFKGEDRLDAKEALRTTRTVLIGISRALAPFMPFLAEEIYGRVSGPRESVHLDKWPEPGKVNTDILAKMSLVRDFASKGLEARMTAKIPVRQPLAKITLKSKPLDSEFAELIQDEVNVKQVHFAMDMETEVALDTNIDAELKIEGEYRELLRQIQDLRKEKGLSVKDSAKLTLMRGSEILAAKFANEIKKSANISEISFGDSLSIEI